MLDLITQNGNFKILDFEERCGSLDLFTGHDMIEGELVTMICAELKSSVDTQLYNNIVSSYIDYGHAGRLTRSAPEASILRTGEVGRVLDRRAHIGKPREGSEGLQPSILDQHNLHGFRRGAGRLNNP